MLTRTIWKDREHVQLKIEKAKRQDAQTALEIRRAAILNQCVSHYPLGILEEWVNIGLSDEFVDTVEKNFYLAKVDDQIVGTGMINIATGEIDAVFVHPQHLRKGVGTAILKFLENIATSHGLKTLTLQSTLNAAEFYRACGFVGNEIKTYTSQRGVALSCIPMSKQTPPHG